MHFASHDYDPIEFTSEICHSFRSCNITFYCFLLVCKFLQRSNIWMLFLMFLILWNSFLFFHLVHATIHGTFHVLGHLNKFCVLVHVGFISKFVNLCLTGDTYMWVCESMTILFLAVNASFLMWEQIEFISNIVN